MPNIYNAVLTQAQHPELPKVVVQRAQVTHVAVLNKNLLNRAAKLLDSAQTLVLAHEHVQLLRAKRNLAYVNPLL